MLCLSTEIAEIPLFSIFFTSIPHVSTFPSPSNPFISPVFLRTASFSPFLTLPGLAMLLALVLAYLQLEFRYASLQR